MMSHRIVWRSLVFCCCVVLSASPALAGDERGGEKNASKPRIIALSPHIVELLFEIGAGNQIVGTTEFADYPSQAKQIPVVGNYLGLKIEAILALQPNLIVAWRGGNVGRDIEKLKKLGLDIVYSEPLHLLDVAKDLRMLGEKTGNTEQAEKQAQDFEQRLAQLTQKYQGLAPVRAFYEIWHSPLTTVAQNGWAHNLLSVCRIQNVFAEINHPYPQVNIEQVLSRNVQLIIQPQSGVSQSETSNQKLKNGFDWQAWPEIPAVKQNRILRPNADKLHRMTTRTLLELSDLCARVHGFQG